MTPKVPPAAGVVFYFQEAWSIPFQGRDGSYPAGQSVGNNILYHGHGDGRQGGLGGSSRHHHHGAIHIYLYVLDRHGGGYVKVPHSLPVPKSFLKSSPWKFSLFLKDVIRK